MLFWILLGALALAILIALFSGWDLFEGFLDALMTLILGGAIAFFVLFGACLVVDKLFKAGPSHAKEHVDTVQLRALGNDDTIAGRFYFLGGGIIEGKQVFKYAYEKDGWTHVGQADATKSRVAEDAGPDSASMTYTKTEHHWWYLTPWPLATRESYDFHIPADSVVEQYEIDVTK